jgi:hypothetical protein
MLIIDQLFNMNTNTYLIMAIMVVVMLLNNFQGTAAGTTPAGKSIDVATFGSNPNQPSFSVVCVVVALLGIGHDRQR